MPQTGLKIWNESDIGRIAGYHSAGGGTPGTLQWFAYTDGKLYAGGGAVQLDSRGVTIVGQAATIVLSQDYTPVNSLVFTSSGGGNPTIGYLAGAAYGSGVNYQMTLAAAPPDDNDEAELYMFASRWVWWWAAVFRVSK